MINHRRKRDGRITTSRSRLMKSIEEITFSDADKTDIKKENANIDVNTAMGITLQYGSAIFKEFCESFNLKQEHAF